MKLPGAPVRILAVAVVLALLLIGVVAREGLARANGDEVRLEIAGIDPRSLLGGHYVELRLAPDFTVPGACKPASRAHAESWPTWVALRLEGAAHRPVALAETRDSALARGAIALRAQASCPLSFPPDVDSEVEFDIGISRFHASQAEATGLETALRQTRRPAYAIVSVGADGRARLKGLEVDGKRTDLDWF